MFDLIGSILAWFYSLVPSYGIAIVFLTLTVMIVATPLTLKSTKSMLQMQRLQPELKAIQNKYKDDRQKMNEELMAFYQENGINPLGGCLPMLIQLPIFLVLFRVVQGITRRNTDFGNQFGWITGRRGGGGPLDITPFGLTERAFDPANLPIDSDMYQDLHGSTEMLSFGIDLSRSAQQVLRDNVVDAIPYLLLILVVLVSSVVQQRQIQGRNTGAQINPQQQMLMKILPFMLPVFSFTMPAALVVYFVVSNLYRIGQQAYITRSLYTGEDSLGQQLARQRAAEKGGNAGKQGAEKSGKSGGTSGSRGGGRTTAKKGGDRGGSKTNGGGGSAKKGTTGGGANASSRGRAKDSSSGAGRTGKAPTRQRSGGGRTTEPGSPQHKKRKK